MRRHITRWNVLALAVLVIGGGLTWGSGQFVLHSWAVSGESIPIGGWHEVELPEGKVLVHYESERGVPGRHTMFNVRSPSGNLLTQSNVRRSSGRKSGRIGEMSFEDQFYLNVTEPGTHRLHFTNSNFNPGSVPEGDRVTLGKEPQTIDDAADRQRVVLVIGACITVAMTMTSYILHVRAQIRQRLIHSTQGAFHDAIDSP